MLKIVNKFMAVLGRTLGLGLKIWLKLSGRSNQVEFEQRVDAYRQTWKQAAEELGAEFRDLDAGLWEITYLGKRSRFANHLVEFDAPATLNLAGRKALVHRIFAENGLEIPDYRVFTLEGLSTAQDFFDRIGEACVVKPENGFGGKGVTTLITKRWRVRMAAMAASLYAQKLLIENQVYGESCRLLVVGGKFVHAVRRRGIWITGNGRDNVRSLISKEISLPLGAKNTALEKCGDIAFCLRHQELGLDTVLASGRTILARSSSELSLSRFENRTAYTEDITAIIGESLKETAEKCARIIGSDYLGVDIITPNIALPLAQCGGIINEVNTTPALHHHLNLDSPESRGMARKVVQCLLKVDCDSDVPTLPLSRRVAQ